MVAASQRVSPESQSPRAFRWDALVNKKIVEISCGAATGGMSTAVHLVSQAQRTGETVAWVQPRGGALYPPDLHDSGVDLAALVVIHVPPPAGVFGAPKAAEILLRSGAYGLVVLDLTGGVPPSGAAWQGRLLALAREHQSAVVILTHKRREAESLGALSSWRIEPLRRSLSGGRLFLLDQVVLKNKTGLLWPDVPLQRRGPWGLW